jgi:SAM-dependent MidA family methyltransferase
MTADSFAARLAERLAREGPMPLARLMGEASDHYYATREPFGPGGDFVTAPEISQMFGELIGAWAADLWVRAGSPPVHLVELGPGRGTLMADMLRVMAHAGLRPDIHLVETSPRLAALQKARFPMAHQHRTIETLPDAGALLLVANELFDALPISQFVRTEEGWALRTVGARDGRLEFRAADVVKLAMIPEGLRLAAPGSIHERGFAGEVLARQLGRRLVAQGGAALVIDYGYAGPALGDTLQAIRGGTFADPLEVVGEGDISAHVDFAALAAAAAGAGAITAYGPEDQGQFLARLGLRVRADRLKALASREQRARIEAEVARLAGTGAMGRLFKLLALVAPGWPEPAGFR